MTNQRNFASTVIVLAAALALSGCTVPMVEGYFNFGSATENYFDPELGTEPMVARIEEGTEFSYDQRMVFSDPETPDFVLEVDLALNEAGDTLTVTVSMSSTESSNSVSAIEITLDNFSWEVTGTEITGVTEDADDFPSTLLGGGAEMSSTSTSLVFTWPGFLFFAPFDHEAQYTVTLVQSEV